MKKSANIYDSKESQNDYDIYFNGSPVSGGVTPTGTKQINIASNGTVTEDVTNYANAEITVNVPNSYNAQDEGKVVSNGTLAAQSSDTVTQNGNYDTTLINSLTVNVSGGVGTVLKTYTVENAPSLISITLTASEIAEYPVIFALYDLTLNSRDFMYFNIDTSAKNDTNRMYDSSLVEHTGIQGFLLGLPYYNASGIIQKQAGFLYMHPYKDNSGYASYSVSAFETDSSDHTLYWIPSTATNTFASGKITVVGFKYTSI